MTNDSLTLVSEKRLRELLQLEKELKCAREIISYTRGDAHLSTFQSKDCTCYLCSLINKYDKVVEAEKGLLGNE